jgi:hypothetical protein
MTERTAKPPPSEPERRWDGLGSWPEWSRRGGRAWPTRRWWPPSSREPTTRYVVRLRPNMHQPWPRPLGAREPRSCASNGRRLGHACSLAVWRHERDGSRHTCNVRWRCVRAFTRRSHVRPSLGRGARRGPGQEGTRSSRCGVPPTRRWCYPSRPFSPGVLRHHSVPAWRRADRRIGAPSASIGDRHPPVNGSRLGAGTAPGRAPGPPPETACRRQLGGGAD